MDMGKCVVIKGLIDYYFSSCRNDLSKQAKSYALIQDYYENDLISSEQYDELVLYVQKILHEKKD